MNTPMEMQNRWKKKTKRCYKQQPERRFKTSFHRREAAALQIASCKAATNP
jgi:hypothetical protein